VGGCGGGRGFTVTIPGDVARKEWVGGVWRIEGLVTTEAIKGWGFALAFAGVLQSIVKWCCGGTLVLEEGLSRRSFALPLIGALGWRDGRGEWCSSGRLATERVSGRGFVRAHAGASECREGVGCV
jgi:hypothetical protein